MTVEEDLDDIDRDEIGILKDLHKEAFINEEYENLKVVVNDGNYTRSINKKSKMIYIPIDFQSVTNAIGKNIFFNNYVEHAKSFR